MTMLHFTQATYNPDKPLNPGHYRAKIIETKNVADPYNGDVFYVIWDIEGRLLHDKFKLHHPEDTKRGYAQAKLKRLCTALGMVPPLEKNPGENVTYDASFNGKKANIAVKIYETADGKNIPYIDAYIRAYEQVASSHAVSKERRVVKHDPSVDSIKDELDDEIPF